MDCSRLRRFVWLAIFGLLAASCGDATGVYSNKRAPTDEEPSPSDRRKLQNEAPIGAVNEPSEEEGKSDDFYHYGEKDYSQRCKPIPDYERLRDPKIVISLDGLSLHLWDRAGDYDEVFRIGVGRIEDGGESLTPTSTDRESELFYVRADEPAIEDGRTAENRRWWWNYSCRIWSGSRYYNPVSGRNEFRSYFAGLPFLRFQGPRPAAYGMHGPISNYWRENGGTLRRGYVSGGCIRMESEAIREVFARIQGERVPVRIQEQVERRDGGLTVNPDRFVNAACRTDSDCSVPGAECVDHPNGDGRFCTKPCSKTSQCPVRDPGVVGRSPSRTSKCVDLPLGEEDAPGYCLTASNPTANDSCGRFGDRFEQSVLSEAGAASESVEVCAPTGDGWFGDHCDSDLDCATGECVGSGEGPGFCSKPCSEYCPDRRGEPLSRCARSIGGSNAGNCVPTCETDADCGARQRCVWRQYSGRSGWDEVCVPI